MKKLLLTVSILLFFKSQTMIESETQTQQETQSEIPKNFQQKVWEFFGNKGLPSLLFIHQLDYAKLSNEEIEKLNIPSEIKESIIQLKNRLTEKIMDILNVEDFTQANRNDIGLLIESGANLNFQNDNGDTALIEAASHGHKDVVKDLINRNVNLNLQNTTGLTALTESLLNNEFDIAELLIQNNADVSIPTSIKRTSLSFAVAGRYLDIARKIIDTFRAQNPNNKEALKEFINTKNSFDGNTVLIQAVQLNDKDLVTLFLENGANPNLKNMQDLSALDIARQNQNQEIIDLLEKYEEKP